MSYIQPTRIDETKDSFQKKLFKGNFPGVYLFFKRVYYTLVKYRFLILGRPKAAVETTKARERRLQEGFFNAYCAGKGLDIGYGGDLLLPSCQGWDFENGNAQYLNDIADGSFDFVYSSHTLEHMDDPQIALTNWWRVLKPGGYLILYVPHRELYERKKVLPSLWNWDHKHFFIADKDEAPNTMGLNSLISRSLSNYKIEYLKVCSQGYKVRDFSKPADGEYSLEAVVRKLP